MRRRGSTLVARARERIRIAAEHDPHAWPERDDDRAILVHDEPDDEPGDELHDDEGPLDEVDAPDDEHIPGGDARPPLGSPAPGAPDVDGPGGGISGPPERGRRTPGGVGRRTRDQPGRDTGRRGFRDPDRETVPAGLRVAAAWSWRVILVGT